LVGVLRRCYKFVRSFFVSPFEDKAKLFISHFDNPVQPCLDEVVGVDRMVRGVGPPSAGGAGAPRVRRRYRPQNGVKMAFALADEAYLKFGPRDQSEANLKITRKFLYEIMAANPDVRAKDAGRILDVALYTSFLVTPELRMMNALSATSAWNERSSHTERSSWWWPRLSGARRDLL
jgi:hypothetical protein